MDKTGKQTNHIRMKVTPGRQPGRDVKDRTRFWAPVVTFMFQNAGGRGQRRNHSTPSKVQGRPSKVQGRSSKVQIDESP